MFPLFDQLYPNNGDDIQVLDTNTKEVILQKIKHMNEYEHEIVFALIRAYHIQHEQIHCILPYNGKHQKKGIKFDFDCFPPPLQHVIFQFVKKLSHSEGSSLSSNVIVP
jgi:hypothetical protein